MEQQTEKGGEAAKSVAEEALRKLDDNINTFNTKTPEELVRLVKIFLVGPSSLSVDDQF